MGVYRVAQVCPNGHVSTDSADAYPDLREEFCSQCGEATMTECSNCNTSIRGHYHVDGFIGFHNYSPPAYCYACGGAFPWTERKIASVIELAEVDGTLSRQEIQQLDFDVRELTKNTAKTQLASVRFKKAMAKVSSTVATGVKEILTDVISETIRKSLWD